MTRVTEAVLIGINIERNAFRLERLNERQAKLQKARERVLNSLTPEERMEYQARLRG